MAKKEKGPGGRIKRYKVTERTKALKILNKNNNDFNKTAKETGIDKQLLYKWRQRADPLKLVSVTPKKKPEKETNGKKGDLSLIPEEIVNTSNTLRDLTNLSSEQKEAVISLYDINVPVYNGDSDYGHLKLRQFALQQAWNVAKYTTDLDKITKLLSMVNQELEKIGNKKGDTGIDEFEGNPHRRGILQIFKQYNVHFNPIRNGNKEGTPQEPEN